MNCENCIHFDICNENADGNIVELMKEPCFRFMDKDSIVVRKHGEWVLGYVSPGMFTPGGNRPWICSECGNVKAWTIDKPKANFCGHCGSDMRERKANG